MRNPSTELLIRQAIGGNGDAAAWIRTQVDVTDDPTLLVMATLLARAPDMRDALDRAAGLASSREHRQLVDIARAHLAGTPELVDALARDHLVDFPSSYLVAWLASGAPAGP